MKTKAINCFRGTTSLDGPKPVRSAASHERAFPLSVETPSVPTPGGGGWYAPVSAHWPHASRLPAAPPASFARPASFAHAPVPLGSAHAPESALNPPGFSRPLRGQFIRFASAAFQHPRLSRRSSADYYSPSSCSPDQVFSMIAGAYFFVNPFSIKNFPNGFCTSRAMVRAASAGSI